MRKQYPSNRQIKKTFKKFRKVGETACKANDLSQALLNSLKAVFYVQKLNRKYFHKIKFNKPTVVSGEFNKVPDDIKRSFAESYQIGGHFNIPTQITYDSARGNSTHILDAYNPEIIIPKHFFVIDHLNDSLNQHLRWLKMYDPIMYEKEYLNKPVFPNVQLRELTPDEIANHKPKGRFQLRAEAYKRKFKI
ncbi:hypothetical protein [Empedobacter sp.]|uniref:hypothetical protein n=1 Tax=Empedobacter sp. TaxID=1927715 RepID=UPI002899620E|nr:hypothetical protein [Empedobacter sp.]